MIRLLSLSLFLVATTCAAQKPCTVVPGRILERTTCAMREVPCGVIAYPAVELIGETMEVRNVILTTYKLKMRPNVKRCRTTRPLGVGVRCDDCTPLGPLPPSSPLQMPHDGRTSPTH